MVVSPKELIDYLNSKRYNNVIKMILISIFYTIPISCSPSHYCRNFVSMLATILRTTHHTTFLLANSLSRTLSLLLSLQSRNLCCYDMPNLSHECQHWKVVLLKIIFSCCLSMECNALLRTTKHK